jgi:hypothetical protein
LSIADVVARPDDPVSLRVLARTAELIRADALLYGLIALYLAVVLVLSQLNGQLGNAQFFAYQVTSLRFALNLLLVWVVGMATIAGIRANPRQPLKAMIGTFSWDMMPRILAGLVLYLSTELFCGGFTTMKNLLPLLNSFAADRPLADIDRFLHFGRDPWTLLQPAFAVPAIRHGVEFLYSFVWGFEFNALAALMATFCTDRRLRLQFFIVFLLSWSLLGGVIAGLLLSGGPAFYDRLAGDPERFGELLAMLATDRGPFPAIVFQDYLWRFHESGSTGLGSGISAFPSLHVAMASLCAITIWRLNRCCGVAAWLFVLCILIGSVGLGWHYAIDGYASLIGVAILWRFAGWAAQFWVRRTDAVSPALV